MTSEANPESPREIIARLFIDEADADNLAMGAERVRVGALACADGILAALAAAGYEITKLEQVGWGEHLLTQRWVVHSLASDTRRYGDVPLYRKV